MDSDQRAWCQRVELSTEEINRLTPEDYEELMLAIDVSLGRPPSFYVEAILEHGHDPTGRTMYHVLWTHGVQSWEPEEHFMDDDGAVTEAFLEYLENITEDYHGSEANPIDLTDEPSELLTGAAYDEAMADAAGPATGVEEDDDKDADPDWTKEEPPAKRSKHNM